MTSGGHPLPILRRADGSVGTVGTPGSLLGALPDVSLADTSFEMGDGDVLLLYTDGVVEGRGVNLAQGEQALRTAVASCADGSAASILRGVDRAVPRSLHSRKDDRALVVLRVSA